ncbi:MAG: hypothetical protein V4555_11125 [Acidobacteriota bacterium]
MSLSKALIVHASQLLVQEHAGPRRDEMRNVCERRAISAAYYALFHHINASAVSQIAPQVSDQTNHRIQRWFEHAEMKRVCGRFLATRLEKPLLDLLGPAASPELRNVAQSFIQLQEARHSADYDLSYNFNPTDPLQLVQLALGAMASWDQIEKSAEANIFILSLLMWKNWEKERP